MMPKNLKHAQNGPYTSISVQDFDPFSNIYITPYYPEKAAEYGLQLLHRNTHLEHCKEQLEIQMVQLKTSYDELKQVSFYNYIIMDNFLNFC